MNAVRLDAAEDLVPEETVPTTLQAAPGARPSARRRWALLLLAGSLGGLLACGDRSSEPERWRCTNPVEVQCEGADCAVEEGDAFTPVEVRFDSAGELSVCAYTGCWEGTGAVGSNAEFAIVTGSQLPFSTPEGSGRAAEDVAVVVERADRIGVLKVGTFAVPITCSPEAS